MFTFSPNGPFALAVFPYVLRGGEDKIELIQEIVSNVLQGFLLPSYLVM